MRNFYLLAILTTCILFSNTLKLEAQNWIQTDYTYDFPNTGEANFGSAVAIDQNLAYIGGTNEGGVSSDPYGNTSLIMGIVTIMEKNILWQKTDSYLKPSDAAAYKKFGASIAVYGNYVVVGATEMFGNGSVYVFQKPSEGWALGENNEIAKLTASNSATSDQFGYTVDISGDVIVVGAPYNDTNASNAGMAYLFEKPLSGWDDMTETAKLTPATATAEDNFGISVGIENDIVVVGSSRYHTSEFVLPGKAFIFEKPVSGWVNSTETTSLTASDESTISLFGLSVSISGSTIVIGAPGHKNGTASSNEGAAYVFEGSGSSWTQQAKLMYSAPAASQYVGKCVAIDGDIVTLTSNIYSSSHSYVHEYAKPETGWTSMTETENVPSPLYLSSATLFGNSISLKDGLFIVGVPSLDNGGTNDGGSVIYKSNSPIVQSKNIVATLSSGNIHFDWTDGNADTRAVFVREGSDAINAEPLDDTIYIANNNFGDGTQIGTSGWYCVFNGTTHVNGVTVTGLSPNTTYRIMVTDYAYNVSSPEYLTISSTNNPLNVTTGDILPAVNYSVVDKKLYNTTTGLEYNLNESETWYPCTDTETSNVAFVAGKVKVRQASYNANEKLIVTLVTPSAPAFTINYPDETTNESAATSIEYNTDNNFSTANLSGEDEVIALTPGTDLYLRTKATIADLASDIQHLVVNSRPVAAAFYLNYEDETAYNVVATAYEYAEDEDFTINVQTPTSQYITVTPGTDLWFRRKATLGSFAGETYFLDVPDRPATPVFTIDYVAEETNETILNTIQYTTDPNFITGIHTGVAAKISLTPETNVYFKGTASSPYQRFATEIFELVVPALPVAPEFSIDFVNETTNEEIPSTYEYASNADFTTGVSIGTGVPIILTPGTNLWFRVKASNTNSNFTGISQALTVSARNEGPIYTINFTDETTDEIIPDTVEYNSDNIFATANTSGENQKIAVVPDASTYFRYKATASAFASATTQLDAPSRPAGPIFTIDYTAETTNETVATNLEYNTDNNFGTFNNLGSGNVIPLTPGTDIYFRQLATSTQFLSEVSTLVVPSRSAAPSFSINYLLEKTNSMVFGNQEYNYSDEQFSEGGTQGSNASVPVTPGGNLYIRWKAQAFSFASETFSLTAPERPQAPTTPIVDDENNTFDWSLQTGFTSTSDYQYSTDNANWQSCTTKPINVGNVDLATGEIQVRIGASDSEPMHFCSAALASDAPFTSELPKYTLTLDYVGSGTFTVNGETYTAPVTVENGTELTIVALPATTWQFGSWSGDLTSTNATETITMNADKSITATFTRPPGTYYYLFLYNIDFGSVKVNGELYTGAVSFLAGTQLTLEATPDAGYQLDGWSGDITAYSLTTTVTMNRTKDIWVAFSEIPTVMRTLTLDITGSGSVNVNGSPYTDPVEVEDGTELTLEASPESGWQFSGWSGDLSSSSTSENLTMNDDKSVSATFMEIRYSLDLTISGNGTITVNGEEYTGPTSYLPGTELTIVATPATGYAFDRWSGDITSTASTVITTINGNKDASVYFIAVYHTLTLNHSGSGSLTVDGVTYIEPIEILEGEEVTIAASPETGWQFDGWSGDLISGNASESITIDGDKTITATFTEIPAEYTITVNIIGDGRVSFNGSIKTQSFTHTATEGISLHILALTNAGSEFSGWSTDTTLTDSYLRIYATKDAEYTATFTVISVTIPDNLILSDTIIENLSTPCFDANQTISLASDDSTVIFKAGSSVTLIAGESIRFLPGFHAESGSDVHAYISNSFCDDLPAPIVAIHQVAEKSQPETQLIKEQSEIIGEQKIKVFPNPNRGQFTIQTQNFSDEVNITIFDQSGKMVYRKNNSAGNQFELTLKGILPGLYYVTITDGLNFKTAKMVIH